MNRPFSIFVSILAINAWTNGHDVPFKCDRRLQLCGDNRCCCSRVRATCDGKKAKLSYIPRFTKNINTLKFINYILPNMSKSYFKNVSNLHIEELIVQNDSVVDLSTDAFLGLQHLKVLRINGKTTNTSQLFEAIGAIDKYQLNTLELRNIGLSGETLKGLLYTLNGFSLKTLVLNKGDIEIVEIVEFSYVNGLRNLDLSSNAITSFNARGGHTHLRKLLLTRNKIARLPPAFCESGENKLKKLKALYLDHNFISVILKRHVECLTNLKLLVISGNVIKEIPNNLIADLHSLVDLRVGQMLGLEGHGLVIHRYAFNSTSLRRLDLDLNNIIFTKKYKENNFFEYCKDLTYLNVMRNNMRYISYEDITQIFSPLKNLERLYLGANHMSAIPKYMLRNFTNLHFLSLDGNSIHELGDSLLGPINLQHLTIQGNNIRKIRPDSFPPNVMKTLKTINMENNPFDCTCDNLWFRLWIGENGKPMGTNITFDNWPDRYSCASPKSWNRKLFKNYNPTEASCSQSHVVLIILITLSALFVICLISVPVGVRYRWYLMYGWYRLWKPTTDPKRRPLLSGANIEPYIYVIYHEDDRHFVRNTLCGLIENDFRLKLFVWDRDAAIGGKADVMFDAIDSSEGVLAIVSNNFVTDGWCEFQLELGLWKRNTIRKDCLTLILLENLDVGLLRRSWCVTLVKNATVDWCSNKESVQGKLCAEKLKERLSSFQKEM